MFSDNIQGWSTYSPIYKDFIDQAQDGAILAEIGVFLGKGIIYGAEYAKSLNKRIRFFAIDTWLGSDEAEHKKFIEDIGGPDKFYEKFLENIKLADVEDIIHPIRKNSVEAARIFGLNSLNMVFLDGSHDYKSVKEDILAWRPKVKKGGILAGHDIKWADVKRAVDELIVNYEDRNDSWVYDVK